MKKLVSLFTPVLLLVWVLSCNRQTDTIPATDASSPESLINEAKLAFRAQVTQLSAQARANSDPTNSFSASKWRPQWTKAVTFDYQGNKVIEVPLLYGQADPVYKTKTDHKVGSIHVANGVTKAVFFKHKDGTIGAYIMEFILDDGYFASKRANNQYKELSLQNLTKDFTGILNFTDLLRNSLANYRYERGRLKALSKKSVTTKKNARPSYCELSTECYTIETTVQIGCCSDGEYNYNPTGNCCADASPPSTRYDTYCENVLLCYPDPPSEPTNPGSPGDNPPTDPNNGNAEFMANYRLLGPDKPINIANRLNCFGTVPSDSKYKYSVTLYVDQPVDGTRNIANFNSGNIPRRPGHTYLGFEQLDSQTGQVIRLVAGFYVQSEMTAAMNVATASAWGDDGGTPYDVSLKVDLSASQFKDVIYQIKNLGNPMYHIVNNNCTTFAYNTVSPYITLPSGTGFIGPLGTGYNPADLGQDLRERQSTYGSKMNVSNGATSPASVNCN